MYYSHACSYCNKVFYTYNDSREQAAQTLYYSIKNHLMEYDEDRKESEFDDGPEIDINQVYAEMIESKYPPSGGYEV